MTRREYLTYGLMSLVAVGLTAILAVLPGVPFRKYFGDIHPLFAVTTVAALGGVALGWLRARGGFQILAPRMHPRGPWLALMAATLFAVVVIPADVLIRFPRDMNVPPPQALLFYPVMGFVVEIVLHAVPLALLFAAGELVVRRRAHPTLLAACLLVVAGLEPVLQLRLGFGPGDFSAAAVFVALHVYAFNIVELWIFRRRDFLSMCTLRLAYYMYWHVIWGQLRLRWLY